MNLKTEKRIEKFKETPQSHWIMMMMKTIIIILLTQYFFQKDLMLNKNLIWVVQLN